MSPAEPTEPGDAHAPSARRSGRFGAGLSGPLALLRLILVTAVVFSGFSALDAVLGALGVLSSYPPSATTTLGTAAQSSVDAVLATLDPGLHTDGPTTVTLGFADAPVGQRLALAAGTVVTAALVAAVCLILLRVVLSNRDGTLFSRANVRRLQAIAGLVGVGGLFEQVVSGSASFFSVAGSRLSDNLTWSVELNLLPVGVALGLLVLAETWRQGVRMREEMDGLV